MQPSDTLKIESLDDGWRDKDTVMLHACFQLLKDCVEKENLLNGHTDWNVDAKHIEVRNELELLYKWWLERMTNEEQCGMTEKEYSSDDEKLHRLIKVRWALWT